MKSIKRLLCLMLTLMMVLNAAVVVGVGGVSASAVDSFTLVAGSPLVIDRGNGLITKLVTGITVSTLKGNFADSVTVYNASGAVASDSDTVGTGFTVSQSGESLRAVIWGDVDCDGCITTTDKVLMKYLLDDMSSQPIYMQKASDVNDDGFCNTADVLSVSLHMTQKSDLFSFVYGVSYELVTAAPKYASASNAKSGTASTGTAAVGSYYIYSAYPYGLDGMFNLTTDSTGKTAGFWINPADNVKSTATATEYKVVADINKYASSTDAANLSNPTGTVTAGTYYIYNGYPNGYNGMYNITTDSTGAKAGFWINPAENVVATATVYVLDSATPKYPTAADALNKTNSTGTAAAGTYYIYNNYPNGYNGMYNLTTDPTGEKAGFWINPNEIETATAATYVLTADIPKYSSAADALSKTNSTGTAAAGTYYIYNSYPDGYNGMYNLTTDSTGEKAGFWINPTELTTDFVNADGSVNLLRNINKYSNSTDAARQTNPTGVIDKDTAYYIYSAYPNGYNGLYNITTDSTGATAGVWINPVENTSGKLNYNTMKGIWITQYEINTMIISGGSQVSKATFTTRVANALKAARNSGYNTVFVQVRPNGDSFYPSSYYPLSKYIVGSYGLTTKYDPLQIFVEQAQELALSMHAWVNPMRLMATDEISSVGSSYLIKQWYNSSDYNGKYIVAHNGYYYLNPAYADVRELIVNGVKEICTSYNVDGIHFDDYFYPDGVTDSFDQAAFSASGQSSRIAFRRACINALVKSTYSAIKAIDSEMTFGISPAGNITNNMNYLGADVKTWCNTAGYIDYIAPQLYWGFEHSVSPFESALAEWVSLVGAKDIVKLVIGLDMSMAYGTTDSNDGTEWTDNTDVIARQITASAKVENFGGVVLFCMRYYYNAASGSYVSNLVAERNNFEPVLKALYAEN